MKMEQLSPDFSPEKQYRILTSGTLNSIPKKGLLDKLKKKKTLRVKVGFDPSTSEIHLGHARLLHKLFQFQCLGHDIYIVVGDFTACIGDPSGKNKTRPRLSVAQVKHNAKHYIKQITRLLPVYTKKALQKTGFKRLHFFFKTLDRKKTRLLYNSSWLDKISLRDFILDVCSKFSVAQMLERHDFSLRYKSNKPLALHEFFYPMLQAYDSVHLKADVELGGSDQLFNLLLGRDLQEHFHISPQVILTFPLLEGLDGKQKMSKSLNNAISFKDLPRDVYGKAMKISDTLLVRYWSFFTHGKTNLETLLSSKTKNNKNPDGMKLKKEKENLAWGLVCALHGEDHANKAEKEFKYVFSKKGVPSQIPEVFIKSQNIWICHLMKTVNLCTSTSAALRALQSGAVRKDNIKLTDPKQKLDLKSGDKFLLSFGKRAFIKVCVEK